jgi:hypothetical protein
MGQGRIQVIGMPGKPARAICDADRERTSRDADEQTGDVIDRRTVDERLDQIRIARQNRHEALRDAGDGKERAHERSSRRRRL